MAARPGEENVSTVFGDVHYFYAAPEPGRPPHHRFDKGSYVYLFENSASRRARVEIANQPGTDEQDAFDGYLDSTRMRYSYRHDCLVTLTPGPAGGGGPNEWHLPAYDQRNENKYHYRLHSVDIYFWTRADALRFVTAARRVLPPALCEILDEPAPAAPAGDHDVSPVVQRLENAALSRTGSTASSAPYQQQQQQYTAPGFPPPPGENGAAAGFAPMAYNPAAPAAPEAIRHREKTPPPPEDGGATSPRALAAAYEQQQPFSPPPFSPPPFSPQQGTYPGAAALQRAPTMPTAGSHYAPGTPGFAAAQPQGLHAGVPPPPPPPQPIPQQQQQQTQQQQQSQQRPQPQSQYSQQPPATPGSDQYALHHQMYVPEGGSKPAAAHKKADSRGRLEENAGRIERGVTGMLKKFEKKFG